MLKQWVFWWKANNRHGIHSPFIYKFLDQGLYRRDLRDFPPDQRLLLAALDYFRPGKVGTFPEDNPTGQWLNEVRKGLQWDGPPFDLIVFDSPGEILKQTLGVVNIRHNDTVVYVGNLRKDGISRAQWKEATGANGVRVVLETYYAGLLFFRREQACQHFRIRI